MSTVKIYPSVPLKSNISVQEILEKKTFGWNCLNTPADNIKEMENNPKVENPESKMKQTSHKILCSHLKVAETFF